MAYIRQQCSSYLSNRYSIEATIICSDYYQGNAIPITYKDSCENQLRYVYVDTTQKLIDVARCIARNAPIGLDCEFIRRTTFFPIPALLQLGWYDASLMYCRALIDVRAIADVSPLRAILEAARPLVMHAASEDIQVLHVLGIDNVQLFDTQIAYALAKGEDSLSYRSTVKHTLGVDIDAAKRIQRSNWLARPLSFAQKRYALLDVEYLLPLYHKLRTQLVDVGRLYWLQQECATLCNQQRCVYRKENSLELWKNLKGSDKLREPLSRSRMCLILDWRFSLAYKLNIACGMLLDDESVLSVSAHPDMLEKAIRKAKFGYKIPRQAIVRITHMLQCADPKKAPPFKNISKTQQRQVKILQTMVRDLANDHAVPARLLASKRHLIAWVQSASPKPSFGAWQDELLAPLFISYQQLQSTHA